MQDGRAGMHVSRSVAGLLHYYTFIVTPASRAIPTAGRQTEQLLSRLRGRKRGRPIWQP